jgi:predicted PurR-regulated permease PerM
MTVAVRDLVPHGVRPFVVDVAKEIDQVLGQFIRGQLTVMLILAVLYAVGYSIAGVRLAVVIGIVAGALAFIPYVGGAVAIGLALLMCLLDFQGVDQILWVLAIYGVVQLLESFVITPKIMGETVGLSAVWVLLALMIGGELFGFSGVLLAVPAAAVAKIFVVRAVAWYRKSAVFLEGAPAAVPAGGGFLAGVLREEGLPDEAPVEQAKADALPDQAEEPRATEVDDAHESRDASGPSEDEDGSHG